MKRKFLPFLFLLSSFFLVGNATAQNFEWAKSMGGFRWDHSSSIALDDSGNVFITGVFSSIVDFDPDTGTFNLTSAGDGDIFVCKLDASGNLIWAKNMGGTRNDVGFSIALDKFGNVYTTGYFENIADFNPGLGTFNLTSEGLWDIFVSKLDASGNFVWAKKIGGLSHDISNCITVSTSGNIYTTGYFYGIVDFDPDSGIFNLSSTGGRDIFVSKLDASGNFVWAKSMGGIGYGEGRSITLDNSENIYTTGSFSDTADFDPGTGIFNLSSVDNRDVFISKLDSLGNFVWAKRMGGSNHDEGYSIAIDASENVYITGNFLDTIGFSSGSGTFNLTSAGSRDIFISKLDSLANFVWAKKMGGTGSDYGFSIDLDISGNIYAIGRFEDSVDFDPNTGTFSLVSAGYTDIFVSKLDAYGSLLWAKRMGGIQDESGLSIKVDSFGNVYTVGAFRGVADFDPDTGTFNLTSKNYNDIFVSKWSQCFIDISTTINNNTLIANQQSANYQWLNCDSSFSAISGATNQSFTPTQNGNYACEISLNGCVDTTACIQIIVTGIEKNEMFNDYNVYPNPFADQITIESVGVHSSTHLEVININGQVVYESTSFLNGKTVLNTANWAKGIYFIRLTNEQGVGMFKLAHQ